MLNSIFKWLNIWVYFLIFGVILQFAAFYYYGTMAVESQEMIDYMLDSTVRDSIITVLYGMSNGTIFFLIYALVCLAVSFFKNKKLNV